jgi:hypothetical protein
MEGWRAKQSESKALRSCKVASRPNSSLELRGGGSWLLTDTTEMVSNVSIRRAMDVRAQVLVKAGKQHCESEPILWFATYMRV